MKLRLSGRVELGREVNGERWVERAAQGKVQRDKETGSVLGTGGGDNSVLWVEIIS